MGYGQMIFGHRRLRRITFICRAMIELQRSVIAEWFLLVVFFELKLLLAGLTLFKRLTAYGSVDVGKIVLCFVTGQTEDRQTGVLTGFL